MILAVDAMGGDHAPRAIVEGVVQFLAERPTEQIEIRSGRR